MNEKAADGTTYLPATVVAVRTKGGSVRARTRTSGLPGKCSSPLFEFRRRDTLWYHITGTAFCGTYSPLGVSVQYSRGPVIGRERVTHLGVCVPYLARSSDALFLVVPTETRGRSKVLDDIELQFKLDGNVRVVYSWAICEDVLVATYSELTGGSSLRLLMSSHCPLGPVHTRSRQRLEACGRPNCLWPFLQPVYERE